MTRFRASAEILRKISGMTRDSGEFDQMTNWLCDGGIIQTKAQEKRELKGIKQQYHRVVVHNSQSGNDQNKTRSNFIFV